MPSSVAREYFDDDTEEGTVFCKICNAKLRGDRLSNLKRHLTRKHKVDVNKLHSFPAFQTKTSIIKPPRKKKINIDITPSRIFRSYIGMVTEDNVPLLALNSPNMRNIMDPICGSVRKNTGKKIHFNAPTCEEAIQLVANDVREAIKEKLKHELISLKITSSISKSDCTYVISAHFWKSDALHVVILDLVKIGKCERSASKLTEEILNTLEKYQIDLQQIVSVTVDREADVCFKSITTTIEADGVTPLEDIQICGCVARALYECSLDILNTDEINKYVNICRNIIRFIEKSEDCQEAFEANGISVPEMDSESSWGSTYTMIHGIQSAKTILNDTACGLKDMNSRQCIITSSLFDFVEDFTEAMGPLYRAIKKYQEKDLHYSHVYTQWLKCKLLTECIVKISETHENSFKYKIGTIVLDKMQQRDISKECLHACLYLDPRFHRILSPSQRAGAVSFLKKLWDKINYLNPGDSVADNSPSTALSVDNEDQLLDRYLSESINHKSAVNSLTVYSKIDCLQLPFMKSDTDVVLFWLDRKYNQPELYQLSRICFAIPPTQMISDTTLTSLRLILESNNDCTDDTLENIFLVKVNSARLDAAVNGSLPLFENVSKERLSLHPDPLLVFEDSTKSWPDMDVDVFDDEEDSKSTTSFNDESNESYKSIMIKEEIGFIE